MHAVLSQSLCSQIFPCLLPLAENFRKRLCDVNDVAELQMILEGVCLLCEPQACVHICACVHEWMYVFKGGSVCVLVPLCMHAYTHTMSDLFVRYAKAS